MIPSCVTVSVPQFALQIEERLETGGKNVNQHVASKRTRNETSLQISDCIAFSGEVWVNQIVI